MSKLPPALEGLASFVDAWPAKVRNIYNYGLCLMIVEAGIMELVETIAGDEGALQGHNLGPFEVVDEPGRAKYQASCRRCGKSVYVSDAAFNSMLDKICPGEVESNES